VLVAVVFQPFNLPFQQAPLSEVVQNLVHPRSWCGSSSGRIDSEG